MLRRLWVALPWCIACGSSDDPETIVEPPPAPQCPAPQRLVGDACIDAGVQDDGCPAGTRMSEGTCVAAGIAPTGCAEGFVHDGDVGCEPILPDAPCPPGRMAVPGDRSCRAVAACGSGKWGDIPVEGSTEHVDWTYAGGDSDGSAAKPWPTIAEAYAAASDNAILAIAEGSYLEDVIVQKRVRIWGTCPEDVEIVGSAAAYSAVLVVGSTASGTEIRGVALRGDKWGFGISGAEDVVLDQVWVHDAASRGLEVETQTVPTALRVQRSLIENNHDNGILVIGAASLVVDASVVRGTLPEPDGTDGRGIGTVLGCTPEECFPRDRPQVSVTRSLLEQNHDIGIAISAADVTVHGTVVRTTQPEVASNTSGRAFNIQPYCRSEGCLPDTAATASITASVIEDNHEMGLFIMASEALIENTVVRRSQPRVLDGAGGRGIDIQIACILGECDRDMRANVTVRSSLIDDNHDSGVHVSGSDASLEGIVVRRTAPRAYDGKKGGGVVIQNSCSGTSCDPLARSNMELKGSVIAENHAVGVLVMGSDALIEGTWVRDTEVEAASGKAGSGIALQLSCVVDTCDPLAPADATIVTSLIERNKSGGIDVAASTAIIHATAVRATEADALGFFGDGISLFGQFVDTSASIENTLIDSSVRAGLASFGAAASVKSTTIQCAAFEITGDPLDGKDFVFTDLGDNRCGCPLADHACKTVSAGLAPPEPIGTVD